MNTHLNHAPVIVDTVNKTVLGTDSNTVIAWPSTGPDKNTADENTTDELLEAGWDLEEISDLTLRPFIDERSAGTERLSQLMRARDDAESLHRYATGRADRALLKTVADTLITRGIAVPGRGDVLVFQRQTGFGRLLYEFASLRADRSELSSSKIHCVLAEVETDYEDQTLADLLFLPMLPTQLQHFLPSTEDRVRLGWMLNNHLTATVISHDPDSDEAPEWLLVSVDALNEIDQNC